MDAQKVDMFIMSNNKYFESHQVGAIRDRLLEMDESSWPVVQTLQFKDPTTALIVSLFAGQLGIDRFLIGDTGLGIGKLLTCGGLGIWAIIDWFMIMGATRERNMEKLQQSISA
ncbi:TM2 domain-containing protein [Robertkochia aurantiaca]|uniref:TM2 domain-containing protein n=1 Tax=Robertkochia aurantiaca TaxID=2873700 RepID=UPI001CCF3C37|nr:TM2 domain-containing protein [Robertkochia sp. 3YJGBD-33]